jgi:hypothetical protein
MRGFFDEKLAINCRLGVAKRNPTSNEGKGKCWVPLRSTQPCILEKAKLTNNSLMVQESGFIRGVNPKSKIG